MSNTQIRHHYVPRSYLRRFSSDGKLTFILQKAPTPSPNPKLVSVADICTEKHFYSLYDNRKERITSVERQYSILESKYPNKLFRIIPKEQLFLYQNGGIILDTTQRDILTEAILLQITRGKSTREFGSSFVDNLYQQAIEETRIAFEGKKSLKKEINYLKHNKTEIINNAMVKGAMTPFLDGSEHSKIRDNLRNRNCVIYINYTGIDLITSDEPILICDDSGNVHSIYNYPLGNFDSQVVYPLDPYHLAVLYTKEYCRGYYCDKGIIAILMPNESGFIDNLNLSQYKNCTNCIIAKDKKSLLRVLAMKEN